MGVRACCELAEGIASFWPVQSLPYWVCQFRPVHSLHACRQQLQCRQQRQHSGLQVCEPAFRCQESNLAVSIPACCTGAGGCSCHTPAVACVRLGSAPPGSGCMHMLTGHTSATTAAVQAMGTPRPSASPRTPSSWWTPRWVMAAALIAIVLAFSGVFPAVTLPAARPEGSACGRCACGHSMHGQSRAHRC